MSITTKNIDQILADYQKIKANARTALNDKREEREQIAQYTGAILQNEVLNSDKFQNGEPVDISPIDIGKAIFGKDEWDNMNQYHKDHWMKYIKEAAKEFADNNGAAIDFPAMEAGKKRRYTFSKAQQTPEETESTPNTVEGENPGIIEAEVVDDSTESKSEAAAS